MKIIEYISPRLVIRSLTAALTDLSHFRRYKSILEELDRDKKLEAMKMRLEKDKLFIGVNLNPELLMYTDDSQESVELKFVSDAMKKYTDFLQKEGVLDSIKADYERVFNDEFYGYVVQVRYDFKKYKKKRMIYDISYLFGIFTLSIATAALVYAYVL